MQICKVLGNITSTVKNDHFVGKKIMIVQPLDLEGNPDGKDYLAIDTVQAGINDRVLVMKEGGSAQIVLQDKEIPVQALILGIVDDIDLTD
jgi:ethanolamine utilization protein EutN